MKRHVTKGASVLSHKGDRTPACSSVLLSPRGHEEIHLGIALKVVLALAIALLLALASLVILARDMLEDEERHDADPRNDSNVYGGETLDYPVHSDGPSARP